MDERSEQDALPAPPAGATLSPSNQYVGPHARCSDAGGTEDGDVLIEGRRTRFFRIHDLNLVRNCLATLQHRRNSSLQLLRPTALLTCAPLTRAPRRA